MYKSKKPYHYGTGRRKSSVARVHLIPNGTGVHHHQRPGHRGILRPGDPEDGSPPAPEHHRVLSARWTWWPPSPAAASPARPAPCATASPAPCCRWTTEDYRARPEGRRLPHPRSPHEGAQEVRPQGCPSRSAVQQALNFIKSGQKPRNYAVSGVFPFQMV